MGDALVVAFEVFQPIGHGLQAGALALHDVVLPATGYRPFREN
jgi:hypothetical protein